MDEKKSRRFIITKGGRNLVLLTIGAILIATLTTGASLLIYHNSGDIYLDRSRPGFLPDEEENLEGGNEEDYSFEKTGELTNEGIDEYLEKLDVEVKAIDSYEKPFGAEVLSDEKLGISEAERTE